MTKKLMKGSEAIGEAAIQAGCRLFFGYPITPQNEIPEYMSMRLPQIGGSFVQAESEVAASNMIYGAAGTGERVMTSSSSPGGRPPIGETYCTMMPPARQCQSPSPLVPEWCRAIARRTNVGSCSDWRK